MESFRRDAVRFPEVGTELTRRMLSDVDAATAEDHHTIMLALLTEARMDRDNNGTAGKPFLEAMEASLSHLTTGKGESGSPVEPMGLMALARCYYHAELPTPDTLTEAMSAVSADRMAADTSPAPDIDAMLDSLRDDAGGDAFSIYSGLGEMLAAFELAMRAHHHGDHRPRRNALR